jgi:hypothetical protein
MKTRNSIGWQEKLSDNHSNDSSRNSGTFAASLRQASFTSGLKNAAERRSLTSPVTLWQYYGPLKLPAKGAKTLGWVRVGVTQLNRSTRLQTTWWFK